MQYYTKIELIESCMDLYCEEFKCSRSELFNKLGIHKIEDTQHWAYVLLYMSILNAEEDWLSNFINSTYYLRSSSDHLYKIKYLDNYKDIPKDLQDFFKTIGTICPLCGGILMEHLYWESDDEAGIECMECMNYTCCNCDYSTSSLDDLTVEFKSLPGIEYISENDKEKIKDCKFKVHREYLDNDSVDVHYCIKIIKDDIEIGKINMQYHPNNWFNTINQEFEVQDSEIYYTYTMELNETEEDKDRHYIECPNCHNKILGQYWLNIKYQGHYNYGDIEEDVYTGKCPICRTEIEDSNVLMLYMDSLKSLEYELYTYQRVMKPLGYDEYPFEDCEYEGSSFAESLDRYKEALDGLTDILNVKYINNIDILLAEQSGKLLDRHSYVITNIFCNTKYYNFKPESINDCKFRILPDIINVHCEAESEEEFDFSTPITTKLMQVWRNNKIIGYIVLSQQYPLELDFRMNVINRASPDGYKTLCDYYSRIYKI